MSPFYYPLLLVHATLTLFMTMGWVSNSRKVLTVLFGLLVLGIFLFMMLGGCFITRIEKKLSGDSGDFTILDPILERLGISTDRRARTLVTTGLFIFSLSITGYKLLFADTPPNEGGANHPYGGSRGDMKNGLINVSSRNAHEDVVQDSDQKKKSKFLDLKRTEVANK